MSTLLSSVIDTFPADGDAGVPTKAVITITLSGTDYDEQSILDHFFVEGPDTDQFIGPGGLIQQYPVNISQGPVKDFLKSPGYQGIAEGATTVTTVGSDTLISFEQTLPFAPLTTYTVHLTDVLQSDGVTPVEGYVTFSFETGSGSIEAVPSDISSSPLSSAAPITDPESRFFVSGASPSDGEVSVDTELKLITITFNQDIDPASFSLSDIHVFTEMVIDHPSLPGRALGELAKTIQVINNQIVIGI